MSRVIGGPLDRKVLDALRERQALLGKQKSRTDNQLIYLNSNHSWIKLSSAVDTKEDTADESAAPNNELAKKYVLLGGTLLKDAVKKGFRPGATDKNSSYDIDPTFGFVPMPGIDNLLVQTKNVFGSLKAATVEFKANSPDQLSDLETLFLRPGFSVLVEWGNTHYLDGEEVSSTIEMVKEEDFFATTGDPDKIQEQIEANKIASKYSYDALFGTIKNFTWAYAQNGEYDCKIDIIGKGELIESIQTLIFAGTETDEEEEEGDRTQVSTSLEQMLNEIKNNYIVDDEGISKFEPDKSKALVDKIQNNELDRDLKIFTHEVKGKENAEVNRYYYLPLSDILAAINVSLMLKYDTDKYIVKFNTIDKEGDQPFVTFDGHFMLDPKIGFIPGPDSYEFQKTDDTKSSLLNIYVNVDLVLGILEDFKKKSKSTQTSVFNLVNEILDNLEKNAGSLGNYDIHFDDSDRTYYVVDRDVVPAKLGDVIPLGLGSTLFDVSLSSKISNRIASFVAIAAQAARTDVGEQLLSMQKWNDGLTDRFFPNKFIQDKEVTTKSIEKKENSLKGFRKQIDVDKVYYQNNQSAKDMIPTHKEFCVFKVAEEKTKQAEALPGLIPLELSLEMKGISGFKVGQGIQIDGSILPNKYKDENGDPVVGFIITGIEHKFQNNLWVTSITSQMFISASI